jgi:protein tyrosine phosphatase (PTP) superfamily phosphohydrolase (DUF442 family)
LRQFDLTTAPGRRRAVLDYLWTDHAYLRLGFTNAHWISEELVRTNQPWPFQLKTWAEQGIRTVINLRGGFHTSFRALEVEACARHGLELVDFVIASRDVPTAEKVLAARTLFETVRYPALMHCKSGADRAGIMAVFYKHFRQGVPIREAVEHERGPDRGARLHLRPLPGRGRARRGELRRLGAEPGLRPGADQGRLPGRVVGNPADRAPAPAGIVQTVEGSSSLCAWMMK